MIPKTSAPSCLKMNLTAMRLSASTSPWPTKLKTTFFESVVSAGAFW